MPSGRDTRTMEAKMLILAALESDIALFHRHLPYAIVDWTSERTTLVSDMPTRRASFRQRINGGSWLIAYSLVTIVDRVEGDLTAWDRLLDYGSN